MVVLRTQDDVIKLGPNDEGEILFDSGDLCLNITGGGTVKVNGGSPITGITATKNGGSEQGPQPQINFIEGSNVTLTVAEDSGNGEIDVTIAASGGGGGGDVTVRKNSGSDVGTRPRLNFIEGSNISLTVADDSGDDEVDVTVAATIPTDEITVRKNSGSDVGTRPRINFIEGSNVTLTVADDAGSNEVDVTIAASGGGASVTSVFSAHRNAAGLAIPNSSTAMTFDTEDYKDSDYTFSAPGDEITIDTTGTYLITFTGSAQQTSGTRREVRWWLEYDSLGAGSWSEVGGSRAYTYHRTSAVDQNSATIHRIMDLTATDKLRFRASSTVATGVSSAADGLRVDIVRLK